MKKALKQSRQFIRATTGMQPKRKLWPKPRKKPRTFYDADTEFRQLYDRALEATQTQNRNNATRLQRHYILPDIAKSVADLDGDFCEIGCLRGLSAYLVASILKQLDWRGRFHICDSFEGLSEFIETDRSEVHDHDTPEARARFICSKEEVAANLAEFDFVELHKGWIPEPFEGLEDRRFAYVHIDVDLYEPTRDSIEFFYPRLVPNGVMVFDDYGTRGFPGARRAIDDCRAALQPHFFIATPPGHGILIKRG